MNKPMYVAAGTDSFRASLTAPSRSVRTTTKHVRGGRTTGSVTKSGGRLSGTPYKYHDDNGIPPSLKPFFRRDVMGVRYDEPAMSELRREFIAADVALHTASDRCIPALMKGAISRLNEAVAAIEAALLQRD